ncbi:hypothetical protein E4P40_11215 [Blastococcus sp. CT_GayMR20]|uniref:hypothetical protein n=1 Tax=Blastococcus sp. CT_GayMR20 TaxID=2559609 RepID=UPI0010743831|nr:hypothetical protein [Blastococcus sp. CT_GayMR20]TFV87499.1 hypothetical protein E4P40_11215 [Blastococcus sp. CT_GayMR20]
MPAPPASRRRWGDVALAAALYGVAAVLGLASVAAVNAQQLLTGEEASVSALDVVAVPARFQPTEFATNFAGHLHFWAFSHLDPDIDLFYGRDGKALTMALIAPLVFLTLRRRLDCGRTVSVFGALLAVLLPGVSALAWLATENGLEAVWGLASLLLATSRRRTWVLAPVGASIAVSTYGAGLAWAAAVALVLAARVVRSDRRLRDATATGVTSVAAVGIVLFPLVWWREGGRVLVGGGSPEDAAPGVALTTLVEELAGGGDSYYFFTHAPALGSPWLAAVLTGALVAATAWRPALWPWTATVALTVILYALSGGILGARRLIAVPVVAAIALAVALELVSGRLLPRARTVLVTAVALAVLGPLGVQHLDMRTEWATGRYALPDDFLFPMAEGRTMPEEVAALTADLNAGEATYREVARERDGGRSLAMVWLLAARRGGDLTGLAGPEDIEELISRGP